jgi:hypothetical protein
MVAKILFYQDSDQFDKKTVTIASIDELRQIILTALRGQKDYRWHYENGQSLWCDVKIDDTKHGRYEYNLKTRELDFFIFWKHSNMVGNGWFSKRSRVIGETATHYTVVYDEKTGQTSEVSKDLLL